MTPYNVILDWAPHTATGTAIGVKAETLSGLDLSGTTHANAGDYPKDPWTFTDVTGNYNNANSTVHDNIHYTVGVTCSGSLSHQILQPINADGTSVFKKGSTVPAKFKVFDANCNSVGTPGVVSIFKLIGQGAGTISDVSEDVISTTTDTAFRWSAIDQQWMYNISTKNLTANMTYVYRITLNDGSNIDFKFGLK